MKRINRDLLGFYFYKYKWYALCYFCLIALAIITGRIFELCIMFISYVLFRYIFPSTLHIDEFNQCIISSIVLLCNGLIVSFTKDISIYSCVLTSFTLCLILYLINYIIVLISPKKEKHNRDKIIEILNGDVSLDNIKEYCKSHGLKEEVAITVDNFLNMTIEKVCNKEYLTETAVKKRIKRFIESANK